MEKRIKVAALIKKVGLQYEMAVRPLMLLRLEKVAKRKVRRWS